MSVFVKKGILVVHSNFPRISSLTFSNINLTQNPSKSLTLDESFPILTDHASKAIHKTMSGFLDLYHFYISAYLHMELPGFKILHRQLSSYHCQQVGSVNNDCYYYR